MTYYRFTSWALAVSFLLLFFQAESLAQCAITDLTIEVSECDDTDRFDVEINFNHENTGNEGFQVLGNGNNYGTFEYSALPVSIEGLIGNCQISFEFIVRDVADPTCSAFDEIGEVCCDDACLIEIINFETTECTDNVNFGLEFDLTTEMQGEEGFTAYLNNEALGEYSYADLPLNLEELQSDVEGVNTFTVCDNAFPDCCHNVSFLNPCFCTMSNITSEIIDCNGEDSTYFVIINFDHVATNDSFQMGYSNNGTNTFLGTFAYADLPVTAGPLFLSDNEQEILILDTDNFFCFNSAYLGVVDDCEIQCQIFNVFGEAYECEEGEYFMDVEFEAEDIEGYDFDILVDGENYGTFIYGENVYTVGPIPSNCETPPVLIVQDNAAEGCSDFYNFTEPICCLPDCNFTGLEVFTICDETMITLNGSFENNGVNLGGFYFIEFLGTSYGPFPYGDFTFSLEVPLIADGEYEITLNDALDPECNITSTFSVACDEQPCMIFNVFAEASECEGELFFVDLEFDFAGMVSDSFEILGNGTNYGSFAYGEPFYTVGPLEGDCETLYEFVISDQIMEGCNSFYAFEEPICCEPDPICEFGEIVILEYECLDSEFVSLIVIDFDYENNPSESFTVSIDGEIVGTFPYIELPLSISTTISANFILTVADSEDESCSTEGIFELDCEGFDCEISNTDVEIVDCSEESGTYFITIDFDYSGTSESFNIYSGDSLLSTSLYSDLPLTFGPFSTGEEHFIFIGDAAFSECSDAFIVFVEQCETSVSTTQFEFVNAYYNAQSLIVENGEDENLSFVLYSMVGEKLRSFSLEPKRTTNLNTGTLPQGIYLLTISDGNKKGTKKILIY